MNYKALSEEEELIGKAIVNASYLVHPKLRDRDF